MKKLCRLGALVAALGVMSGAECSAQGLPDHAAAPHESTCDGLAGATPGLYGLCVAFCEIVDCHPDWGAEDPYATCEPGAAKLLEHYQRRMAAGDPQMPCTEGAPPPGRDEEPLGAASGGVASVPVSTTPGPDEISAMPVETAPRTCPCWSPDELAALPYPAESDFKNGCLTEFDGRGPLGAVTNGAFWSIVVLRPFEVTMVLAAEKLDESPNACALVHTGQLEDLLSRDEPPSVTDEELAACRAELAAAGAARGFDCFRTP